MSLKSNLKSSMLRDQGNQHCQQRNFIEALKCYNEALCYVQDINSREAAFCFANRSLVYMHLELPQQCLENIELARNAGYPANKLEKLNDRKERCNEMIAAAQIDPADARLIDFFKLSYPAHENAPFLANCVEMRENERYGRCLHATQDLKPGDVIAVVEPAMKSLIKKGFYERCTNCLKMKAMNLMPCKSCVSVMFCSKECQDEANETYHQDMCSAIDKLPHNIASDETITSFIRWFFEFRHAAGGFDKLKAICTDTEIKQKTFFDYDLSSNNPSLKLDQFMAALGSELSFEFDPNVFELLMYLPPLFSKWTTLAEKEDMKIIMSQLSSIPSRLIYNDAENNKEAPYGNAVDIVEFKHSCSPNALRQEREIQTVFIVSVPIKKGKPIFQCIG